MGNSSSKGNRHASATSSTLSTTAMLSTNPHESKAVLDHRYADFVSSPVTESVHQQPNLEHKQSLDPCYGHDITSPAPPPRLRRLSELIDPTSLQAYNHVVKSPSGNVLGRKSFVARDDRPLSLRERQERVRLGVSRQGSEAHGHGPGVEREAVHDVLALEVKERPSMCCF